MSPRPRLPPLVALVLTVFAIGCTHAPTPREHALIALSRGRTAEGIGELEAIVRAHPDDPRALVDLGHGYELAHRYDDALASYDRAADVAPRSPVGPREGGLRAAAWGEWEAAEPRLAAAIARGENTAELHHALGVARLGRKDFEGAREAYLAGLAAPDGARDASCVLGLATVAVATDDVAGALRWYAELARRRPSLPSARLGLAWALGRSHRIDDARRALASATELGAKTDEVARLRTWLDEGAAAPASVEHR